MPERRAAVQTETGNAQDAIELLDEWGNAEQALLSRMPDCNFDFRLRDDGQIELVDIGGSTHNCIMETCYPVLDKAFASAEWDETGARLRLLRERARANSESG